jgi:hypothetical protein
MLAPPVWDTAMGVFPPAIFLYETNFDLLELAKQPNWWLGGPNVHTLSLWTWLIALIMSISDSPTITFATLHIITFMVNAFAISALVRTLYQYGVSPCLALMSGLLLLLMPLVLVQIGYMYTESLVMSLSILAWASWHNNREGAAVLFALIAIGMKMTGVVIAACIGLLLLLRLIDGFSYKRLLYLTSLPLALLFVISAQSWLGALSPTHGMSWGNPYDMYSELYRRLSITPELTSFICLGAFAAFCYAIFQWRQSRGTNPFLLLYRGNAEIGSRFIALIYTPIFGIGIIVMSFAGMLFLHRYVVPMIPFAIVQMVLLAQLLKFQRELSFIFVIGCLVSIYNHGGVLYNPTTAFSIVEASHAYKPYVLAQKTIIDEIEKLGNDVPIYVSREIDYMTSNPMVGYVTEKKPNIYGIYKPQYTNPSVEEFPSQFYAVFTNPGHGGARLINIINQASQLENWQVFKIYRQNIGGYTMFISRVINVDKFDLEPG